MGEPFKKKRENSNFVFWPKMRQKNAKKKKIVSGPLGCVKTYLDTKFQLIWPSNEARASSDHFFGIKWAFCVWSHYMLLNLCKNLQALSLRSVLTICWALWTPCF